MMFNIREACYYYVDEYFSYSNKIDKEYEKKFAKAIFKTWPYLHQHLPYFDEIWREFMRYVAKIPSFGAIILNKQLDKILMNIYLSPQDDVINKLDFPKGKVNEGEDDVTCAIREIKEEIGFDISRYLNPD